MSKYTARGTSAVIVANSRALNAEFQRAIALHAQNRFAEAEHCCHAILDRSPKHFDALHLLGMLAHQNNRHEEAVAFLAKAASINPRSAQVHINRASALTALNRIDDALASYDKAIKISANPITLFLRGNLLARHGRFEEAASAFARAFATKGDFADAYSNHANCMVSLGRFEEALKSFKSVLALRPDADDYYNNGIAFEKLGRFKDAVEAYDQAIAANPRFAEAYANRGNSLKELGQLEDALASINKAVAIDPGSTTAYYNRGIVLRALGSLQEARLSYERSIALDPNFVDAFQNLSNILIELKDFKAAEQVLAKIQELLCAVSAEGEKIADLKLRLGSVLQNLDRPQEARTAYEHALHMRPDFIEAYICLGGLLQELGDIETAQTLYFRALVFDPDNARVYFSLAETLKFSKEDSIIKSMERIANLTLSDTDRLYIDFALGKAYSDVKDYEKSFKHFISGAARKRATLSYDEGAQFAQFDCIESTFTASLLAMKRGSRASKAPIFILGMPRSGTTLIEQILASHPFVYAAGELGCFQKAINDVRTERRIFDEYPKFANSVGDSTIQRIGERYLEFISEIATPDAFYITDKMPGNFIFIGLIHLALPNAKIIHTRRDPVDTCISCFSKLFSEGQAHTYDLGELGRYYRRYEKLMAHWHKIMPSGQILDVNYESIVADLETETRRILSFCGLPWNDQCLSFHKTHRRVKTASYAQVRQPLYSTSVNRRRNYGKLLGPLIDALNDDAHDQN